jgi:membrane fusion protein, multidrug efflux system
MMENQKDRNQAPDKNPAGQVQAGNNGDPDIDSLPLYKKKRLIIPLMLLLIGVVVGTYYWYVNMQDYVSTDDAYVDADRVSMSTKILGRIDFLGAQEGDTVKAGQILVKLDDTDLRSQEASAEATIKLAEESMKLSQVQIESAEDDFKRDELQFKGGVITKEQYDHAQKALEAARATHNINRAKIEAAKSQLGVIETQLQNTILAAPMDGIIAKKWVLSGDVVQPGQPVYTIYEVKDIWVTANMEETKVGKLHINSAVEISVDSYPGVKFFGKVYEIGMYTASEFSLIPPNNASGNFTKVTQRVPVKISISNPGSEDKGNLPVLRPGMSVEVSVKVR